MLTGQSFCPLLPGETLDPFAPIDTNATDVGATTINGETVEHFEWSDYDKVGLAGPLPGYTTELFVWAVFGGCSFCCGGGEASSSTSMSTVLLAARRKETEASCVCFRHRCFHKVPIVGRVKMDTVEFYVTPGASPVPVFSMTKITPCMSPNTPKRCAHTHLQRT